MPQVDGERVETGAQLRHAFSLKHLSDGVYRPGGPLKETL
jgi:hypothetical protein